MVGVVGRFLRLALSPDGRLLAAPGWELPFPVWDTQTGKVAFVVGEGRTDFVPGLAWDAAGDHLAVAASHGPKDDYRSRVLVLSRTGAEVGMISGEPGVEMRWLSIHGDVVATTALGDRDDPAARGIRLWNWRNDRLIDRIDANAVGVEFDPAGDKLITSRLIDNVVDVWDAHTGERVSSLEGHTGVGTDVAFDATGTRVATTSTDGSVRIWDPRTGREQLALRLGVPQGAAAWPSVPTAGTSSPPGPTASPGSGRSTWTIWWTSLGTG